MLRTLAKLFSPRRRISYVPVRVPVRAKYDAAQTTPDNRRHWANADGLSAAAANNRAVRKTLRDRARYEYANNTYCKGIVDTLTNHVIGYGPHIHFETRDADANRRIKTAWNNWAKEIRLAQKLRTMRTSKTVDGEAFGVFVTNNRLRSPIKLDLQLIEADQVTDDREDAQNADGVHFDTEGNVTGYTILAEHPGGRAAIGTKRPDPTPASAVIHWFRADRPGQVRGIPEITPALPLFAQLRRFTLAVIAAAETAADFAAIMYTDAPAGGDTDEVDPFLPIDIEQRSMLTIPAGWKMAQFKAEQPASTYAEFKREIINEIARCIHMPFNIAAANSSNYNYSSGQLDHQTYGVAVEIDQDDAEIVVLQRIFITWLQEAALIPGLLPPVPYGDWMETFTALWPSRGHADPTKVATAQATKLANHTTTLEDEWAAEGFDWQEKVRQRARELALLRELQISQADASPHPSPESDDAEKDDEEEKPAAAAAE